MTPRNKTLLAIAASMLSLTTGNAQQKQSIDLTKDLGYKVEMQASFSSNHTPLWLNANHYGLSSLNRTNGYVRAAVGRPLETDSARRWGFGYKVDLAIPIHYTSDFVVQQAYAEARWLKGTVTIGAKEQPMELKNNRLSTGSQTLGINARPVPQVRLALAEYWAIPFTHNWISLKGHVSYGMMTDNGWQHSFTGMKSRYTDNVLLHTKAGYIKIGNGKIPFSAELGLEMATQFGGTTHVPQGEGKPDNIIDNDKSLGAFWNAFTGGGADVPELGSAYQNVEGNQLGSWVMRLNWEKEKWKVGVYADHFFEDHSGMFFLDYDGYGKGDEWMDKKDNRYLLYPLKDIMLGAEFAFKEAKPVQGIVIEYVYTKYGSGPIYHDHTASIPDHIGGTDWVYNHYIYPGWQHWGQVMGNPLYRSPIYNNDGTISVQDNRFLAWHIGIEGRPLSGLYYRALGTWQEGLGTYDDPYTHKRHNGSILIEATYTLQGKTLNGWSIKGAYGMDFGSILGRSTGFQFTISKAGLF